MNGNETKPDEKNRPGVGIPGERFAHENPEGQPCRETVVGLPRMVLEARTRLGPTATPEQVARELQNHGVDTTADIVRKVWDEGHQNG